MNPTGSSVAAVVVAAVAAAVVMVSLAASVEQRTIRDQIAITWLCCEL